jgi:hypothetical protein
MRPLAQWPVFGVVLACILWVVLCVLAPLLWVEIELRSEVTGLSGSGGVAAASFGVDAFVVVLPPLLFWLTWFIARRRNRADSRGRFT